MTTSDIFPLQGFDVFAPEAQVGASGHGNAPRDQAIYGILTFRPQPGADMVRLHTGNRGDDGSGRIRIRVHYDPDLQPEDTTTIDGIPVTTPARTLLDLATCTSDEELEHALETALRRKLTSRAELVEVMARYPRHAGIARLTALLARATGSC